MYFVDVKNTKTPSKICTVKICWNDSNKEFPKEPTEPVLKELSFLIYCLN
jgi:hypothetical protein